MSDFRCQTCDKAFSIPEATLAKYPGWQPRFCRTHSPKKSGGGAAKKKAPRSRARSATVEENLTLAEVLERYTEGPQSGVFTDGACAPNPGPGGWGVVWVKDGEVVKQKHGHDAATTNNRMELMAIIEAFELLDDDAEGITIFSDSKLCIDTLDSWAAGWEKRGWKRKTGAIKNLELVQRAYALRKARADVKLAHISAHAGNRWNEYADSLSTAWSRATL